MMHKALFTLAAIATMSLPLPAAAQTPAWSGTYVVDAGPDAGGWLDIQNDGTFEYEFAAGALDERASGSWTVTGNQICLRTEPRPKPPEFKKMPPIVGADNAPTLFVSSPRGRGIAGIDFVLGMDDGSVVEDYTQADGWTKEADDKRTPLWVELREAIYDITAPRFVLTDEDQGRLHVQLVANDIGIVDFAPACLTRMSDYFVLTRDDGVMRFRRIPPKTSN